MSGPATGLKMAGYAGFAGLGSKNVKLHLSPRYAAMPALLCALLAACGEKAPEVAAPKAAIAVELAAPVSATWPDVLVASGEVAAWQEASIGAEVGGVRLDEVLVNVGDVVHKGQLLARFNEDTLNADLARLDAAVAEATANLSKANQDVERADRLATSNALSAQQVQAYHTQAAVAQAQLASAQALRNVQALKLKYARVTAPDDGTISARSATVGAVSNMGVELFRLVRRNRLEWRAEVAASALGALKPGAEATLTLLDGSTVTGKLRQLSPMVDAGTRNGLAYVDLNAGRGLAAGMYLTGRFNLPGREALSVPESAVVVRDGNRYLMKVDTQNHVHEIKVATGRRANGAVEILGGISSMDRFVVSGGAFVNEGDLVQVVTTPAKAP